MKYLGVRLLLCPRVKGRVLVAFLGLLTLLGADGVQSAPP